MPKPTRSKLGLEALEDRWAPANLDWTDADPTGNHRWDIAGNWKDTATGQAPATPPQATDTVNFPGNSPQTCTPTNGTGDCKILTSAANWGGDIKLDNATIHVSGGTGTWNSGSIDATGTTSFSELYVDGANISYNGAGLKMTT
jgi:hypothetical protein